MLGIEFVLCINYKITWFQKLDYSAIFRVGWRRGQKTYSAIFRVGRRRGQKTYLLGPLV
jgi:hypothetical protein